MNQRERAFGMLKSYNKVSPEREVHRKVVQHIKMYYPEVRFASSHDGEKFSQGQAVRIANLSSHNGHPDLMVYYRRGDYVGLAIELKKKDSGKWYEDNGVVYNANGIKKKDEHLQEQAQYIKYLRQHGWAADFAKGYEDAVKIINWYFNQ
jgi:hypothetical protein